MIINIILYHILNKKMSSSDSLSSLNHSLVNHLCYFLDIRSIANLSMINKKFNKMINRELLDELLTSYLNVQLSAKVFISGNDIGIYKRRCNVSNFFYIRGFKINDIINQVKMIEFNLNNRDISPVDNRFHSYSKSIRRVERYRKNRKIMFIKELTTDPTSQPVISEHILLECHDNVIRTFKDITH